MGSNIEGKKQRFMPYAGGLGDYVDRCRTEADGGFPAFVFTAVGDSEGPYDE